MRPTAIHVTRNLPPLRGGMERLNLHIAQELARECDLHVVGPRGAAASMPWAASVRELSLSLPKYLVGAAWAAWRAARRLRPRFVFAGSGLTAPLAWFAARTSGARYVVYLHGLDIIAPHPVYRLLWRPILRRADLALVNSRNTARLAESAGIDPARIRILHPGVELPQAAPDAAGFRAQYGLAGRRLLLSVGRMTPRKGLLEFVERALPAIVAAVPDACLVVIGDEAQHALHAKGSGMSARVLEAAQQRGIGNNVRLLGPVDEPTLLAAYAASDVHVFPVRDLPGDVEGFGMVALESAAHGLTSVAFDVGGVADAIADGRSGTLVPADDYAALSAATLAALARGRDAELDRTAREFAADFAWPRFGERLRALLLEDAL